ncbi:hypothetical protein RV11_GL002279 [Enterococcus phoeniculicola]|nr:hypothetical protein RV11_GL002279 [Enterococcus phoeniculicola]
MAGTVIQIVGVFDELDQETAVVELNGVAYDLAPLEENKEVSLKETDY